MRNLVTVTALCLALYVPSLAHGQAITLQPASPQPSKRELSPGLTVNYAIISRSVRTERVAAGISGYIHFKSAGNFTLDFLANDGLQITIGGQEVGFYDGIHPCGYVGEIKVNVPSAGYYPLDATYFQRKGTACLMMEWGPESDGLELVTREVFFHKP